ncbi:hypothetical protein TB1_009290 [Malus domestica]
MRTLSSPSSRVAVEKKWVGRENVFPRELEPCFLRPRRSGNLRFLNLVCFLKQSKPVIRPIICLSSKTQTELEIADSQIQETHHTKAIHVKFQLQKECSFGQEFLIVGDDPMFGLWDPASAIPMIWSDGNVWTVELDIPVGKLIQFKFILKESTGNISWQPGPDRIFQTWETRNRITVSEDWADAELQKIIEEDRVSNQSDGSNVNADMLIMDENLTQPNGELAFNTTNDPKITNSNTDSAENPSVEPRKERIGADNGSPSQENMTPKWPKAYVEPYKERVAARTAVLNEERVIFPSEDSAAISSKELLVADNIFGNNGRAATVMNLTSTHIEGSLVNHEEDPVLVPGLTPSPAVPNEEVNKEGIEKQMSFDGSVGAFEAKDRNMPEAKEKWNLRFLNLVCFLKQSKPVIRPIICLSSKTQTELEIADSQIQETHHTKTIRVRFQLQKECSFGQEFLIVGDDPMFGLWDPASAIPMNWSDGNVWTVELDISVGKSIQFKFILQESTGNISWQPGPDRIFQTWETMNRITVSEDWADAELQKIIEEDQVSNQSDGSNVNADMLNMDENLTQPNGELAFNTTNEPKITNSNTDSAEKPSVEPRKEQIGADNGSPSQENVNPKWPKAYVESYKERVATRTAVLNEERVIFPSEDSAAISSKELLVADNICGNNDRAATVMNLSSTHVEGSLVNHEEGPVLVPGLTPSPAVPNEEVNKEGIEKQMSFDGSVGAFEAKDRNMPELDEKQEPYSDLPEAETSVMINGDEENFDDEQFHSEPVNDSVLCNGQPQVETASTISDRENSAKGGGQSNSEPINKVVHNDMQWGRRMLQNLLSDFRLFWY